MTYILICINKIKHWYQVSMVLEKTLESPLDCREIQPVHPKGDQSWVFIGRTDVEAETPILRPPDAKSWPIWKGPDAGKDWGQEEKGMIEDEMVGWHYQLKGHGVGWTPGVGDGQGGLECCGSWGCKESDTTERLNCTAEEPSTGGYWNLLKKITHVQGQRRSCNEMAGGVQSHKNQILYLPDWWPKLRTIIPRKFSHSCKVSRPHIRLPNLGIQKRAWESQGSLILKVSGI